MPGMWELIIILLIVMLIFGAGKLPAIGDALGRSIKNFRRATSGKDEIEVNKNKELGSKKRAELDEPKGNISDDMDEIEDAEVVDTRRKAAAEE